MKQRSLHTLARVQRWELDQLRRQAAELQSLRNGLASEDQALVAALERERAIAAEVADYAAFTAFVSGVRARRERLARSIAEIDGKLDLKREEVAETYQEMKRYETLEERQRQRRRREALRAEQAQLDEIGLNIHRRRQGADIG